MSWYEQAVLNPILERVLGHPQITAQRREALADVRGDVLEIGVGTGLNVPALPASVRALTALTPAADVHPLVSRRAHDRGLAITHVSGSAEALPCDDASFDSVITTFLFCSLPDPAAAARECLRVLRPAGRLFFLEHVLAEHRPRRVAQRIFDLPSRLVLCGCSLVRDTPRTLQAAGFEMDTLVHFDVPPMPITHRYLARGMARKRATPISD